MYNQKRYAPAANGRDSKKEMWQLTKKQWLVYYWILAHSYWNPTEDHYFIYKNQMPSGVIQREVGASAPTIRSALTRLQSMGIVSVHPTIAEAYILNRPPIYTSLDTNIIKFCLAFHEYFGSDLVTFYAILRRLFVLQKVVKFNLAEFALLMGYLKQNVTKEQIHLMLAICQSVGLMTVEEKYHTNTLGSTVCTFIITDVKDVATKELMSYYCEDMVDRELVKEMISAL